MSKLLICVDSFKGSIGSLEAAEALATGWLKARPQDQIETVPFADGGEGTIDAIQAAIPDSKLVISNLPGVSAEISFLSINASTAVVELSRLCGLHVQGTMNPLAATTYPLGLGIRLAIETGHKNIYVALGGSASTDGGSGALEALGAKLLTSSGEQIERGNHGLAGLANVDLSEVVVGSDISLVLLSDVDNPLLGPRGAVNVFAKQKGAKDSDLPKMESNLSHFAGFFQNDLAQIPGTGAAGGTGFGLTLLGGNITSGARHVADLISLHSRVSNANFVITGEGGFDSQSEDGKAVSIVTRECAILGKPCFLVAGRIEGDTAFFASSIAISDIAPTIESSIASAASWLEVAGEELARKVLAD